MIDGLPLLVLVFFVMLVLVAFWRLVLMICVTAFLTVFALGCIEVLTWLADVL
jgi:hypothetical protein